MAAGNVTSTIDALGNTTGSANYLASGQVSSVAAGGNSTSVSYNDDLTVNQVTGTNSDTVGWGYSSVTYRPVTTNNQDGSVTHYAYSDGGVGSSWNYPFVTTTTSPMGKQTQSVLDGFGRTIRTAVLETRGSSQVWISTQTQYNSCSCSSTGKAVATSRPYHSDASGNAVNGDTIYWTTTISDGMGRPVSVTLPDSHQTTYAYAIENDTVNGQAWLGSQVTVTSPGGKQKRTLTDGFGNLLRVDEPNASSTLVETARYTYDVAGRMLTVGMRKSDGSYTQTRTFTYSVYNSSAPWGMLASSTTPEKGTVSYTYYANGQLNTKTDAKGQTLTYVYDSHNRLTAINNSSGTTLTSFGYDTDSGYAPTYAAGRMTSATSNGYTWHYGYDVMGRVTLQTLQTPFVDSNPINSGVAVSPYAQYTYDSDSKMTGMVMPGGCCNGNSMTAGPPLQYTYDAVGRATGMNSWQYQSWVATTSNATYNAAGQMTGWQEGTMPLTRSYDPLRGWLTSLYVGAPGYNPVLNMQYAYNADGQATTVTDSVNPGQGVTSYTYDSLNRLAAASTPNWSMTYAYDEFGNRTSQAGTGTASALTQTLAYTAATNQISTSGYQYDANGNMTQMPGWNYTYDAFDRLSNYTNGSSVNTNVRYDAFGRRIARSMPDGSTRFYFYDTAGKLITEYNFSTQTQCTYYGNQVNCADFVAQQKYYTYFAGQQVGQWTDRVGTVRYTNSNYGGSFEHHYPYGEEITTTSGDAYKFAQTYRDADSGLDYAGARYYASGPGRFLSVDPEDSSARPMIPQSLNRYSYAWNDPANVVDSSGRNVCILDGYDAYIWGGESWGEGFVITGASCWGLRGWGYRAIIDDSGGGGGSIDPGIMNALNGLAKISTGDFEKKNQCQQFFNTLVSQNNLNIDAQTLMNEVTGVAADANQNNFVYDGPSSSTPLTQDKFPGAASPGVTTVGQWFGQQDSSAIALSQANGSAIFIVQSQWSGLLSPFTSGGTTNQYGLGVLLHELLHKNAVGGGFTHDQMAAALSAIGAPGGDLGQNAIGSSLGKICF